jgi:hypothetical protein
MYAMFVILAAFLIVGSILGLFVYLYACTWRALDSFIQVRT